MRYLTYDEYLNIGGTLEKTAFERVIGRACGIIDLYTQKRLQSVSEPSERVCACIRDLVEHIDAYKGVSDNVVSSKSQSAGGVSESETYATKSIDDSDADIRDIIQDYLWSEETDNGVPLLYRGCMR